MRLKEYRREHKKTKTKQKQKQKQKQKNQARKTDTYSKFNVHIITVLITFKIWAYPSILENIAKIRFIDNVHHCPMLLP